MVRRKKIMIVGLLFILVSIPSLLFVTHVKAKNEQALTVKTFKNDEEQEVIRVTSSPKTPQFRDLKKSESGYEEVMALVEKEIIKGYGDNTFRPYNQISRQHVAAMLYRALDLEGPANINVHLAKVSDVPRNHDYATEIAAVIEAGVFQGSNGKFNPKSTITRGQMATVLVRAFDLQEQAKQVNLIDLNKIDKSHRNNVKILAQNNITTGKTNKKGQRYFDAGGPLSRIQFSMFLERTLLLIEDDTYIADKQKQEEITAYEDAVVKLTNKERIKHGLAPLKLDSRLRQTARAKTIDMYEYDYFDHASPVYGSLGQLLDRFNVNYRLAGENIAMGYPTPEAVVSAWMNSPAHRSNILHESFTHIGVGYVKEKHLSTQHFTQEW